MGAIPCRFDPGLRHQYRGVEQLVARRAHNPEVGGSSPPPATTKLFAQMAESVDALVSNTSRFTPVPVRPRLRVLKEKFERTSLFFVFVWSAIIAIAISCLCLIIVFENEFSANISQTQTIYDCNRLLRSAQTCCDRSTHGRLFGSGVISRNGQSETLLKIIQFSLDSYLGV